MFKVIFEDGSGIKATAEFLNSDNAFKMLEYLSKDIRENYDWEIPSRKYELPMTVTIKYEEEK